MSETLKMIKDWRFYYEGLDNLYHAIGTFVGMILIFPLAVCGAIMMDIISILNITYCYLVRKFQGAQKWLK